MNNNTEPTEQQSRSVPRRRFFQTVATAIGGLFGIRAVSSAPPEDAEREADYYRPLFKRGKDLAG